MRLTVTQGPARGETFTVAQPEVTLGRRADCPVCLSQDQHVSRIHAAIRETPGGYLLEDAGSHNGTLLDGQPVLQPTPLSDGAEIRVGTTVLRVEFAADDDSPMEAHEDLIDVIAEAEPRPLIERRLDEASVDELPLAAQPDEASPWTAGRVNALRRLAALAPEESLEDVLERTMDQLFAEVPAERGYLLLLNEHTGKLAPRVVRRRSESLESSGPIEVSRTMVERALKNRCALLTSDAISDESLGPQTASLAEFGIRSALCVPLVASDLVLGLILLDTRFLTDAFTEADLDFVSTVANVCALHVNSLRLASKLHHEQELRRRVQRYVSEAPLRHVLSGKPDLELGGNFVEVTLLQADIRGFTALAERIPPRQLMALLNEFFTSACTVIEEHDGSVDKFVGDAILAVFGSPDPDEGQSFKAVRCALQMLEVLTKQRQAWAESGRPGFDIGLGVSRGSVIHGNVGSEDLMQFSVIGDAVNTCSRLCDLAGPSEVLISESVFEHVWMQFHTVACEPVTVKGKHEPLKTYRVLRERTLADERVS